MIPKKAVWGVLFLLGNQAFSQVVRQPYLQVLTPTSIEVRWNTGDSSAGTVHYGTSKETLDDAVTESEAGTFHRVKLEGLSPGTTYYYSVDTLDGSDHQYFRTSPTVGSRDTARIWVISDFGQTDVGDNTARKFVLRRWKDFNNDSYHADLVLSLGDQTEDDTQEQLQQCYFDLLDSVLLNSPLFTIEGNHDAHDNFVNYLATFTMPAEGESGGYPSNTQDYYSLDYGNIHIIGLSTEIDDINGTQLTWLRSDLQNIDPEKTDWLIACLHRPFHSGGYHPTDESSTAQKQRNYWLKELEDYGVDIVLQGHNAIYERSFLIDNLLGKTTELTPENTIDAGDGRMDGDGAYYKGSGLNPHHGTVFIEVAPGGDAVSNNAHYQIFSCTLSGSSMEGSVVIDVKGETRIDVYFLCNTLDASSNYVRDYFTIIKADSINTGSEIIDDIPEGCRIKNYPNPFHLSTRISYGLNSSCHVKIAVYDLLGRRMAVLEDAVREAGEHSVEWTPGDENGNMLPDGIYIAQVCMGKTSRMKRLMLFK